MANVTTTLLSTGKSYFVRANLDTAATDDVIFDVSAATPVATRVALEEIWWSGSGAIITLEFDATTDSLIMILGSSLANPHTGYLDFREFGGIVDPQASGFTGDILATVGTVAGSGQTTIFLKLRRVA